MHWDLEYNYPPKEISLLHNVLDEETAEEFGADQYFVTDRRGYASVMDSMIKEMGDRTNIKLNTCVK